MQKYIAGSTKVQRIKIALVFRPDPKKAVARPSKKCCRQASKQSQRVVIGVSRLAGAKKKSAEPAANSKKMTE